MIKDIEGKEIRVGCMVESILGDGSTRYRRVDYVGEDKVIFAEYFDGNIEKARKSEGDGICKAQGAIIRDGFKIAEYKALGVFDSEGTEYHEQDEIEYNREHC